MTPTAKRIYNALMQAGCLQVRTHERYKKVCAIIDRELAPLIAEVKTARAAKKAWEGVSVAEIIPRPSNFGKGRTKY